jgi:flagellar motor switch protein FliM
LKHHQEEFAKGLASRLTQLLRLEFSLKLTSLQTVSCRTLADSWANPSQLTLFKTEPLRGVSILELPPRLACAMVDRLMGGPGHMPEVLVEMSEIEQALLEQAVQIFLEEWCGRWAGIKDLKPIILGSETNGRFVQAGPPETSMLVISLEGGFGENTGQIKFGFPYASLEPLIRVLAKEVETTPAPSAAATAALKPAAKWNGNMDDIRVPVTASWQGLEMSAREITSLKIGDMIPLDVNFLRQVDVRLADQPKFHGRPGTIAGQWAVELTQLMDR